MSIKVFCIGKTSEEYLNSGMSVYLKRLLKYGNLQWIELTDVKKNKFSNQIELKHLEGKLFLREIGSNDFVIGLDEKGKQFTSREFATWLNQVTVSNSNLVFIIGGAFGYSEELYQRMNYMISMSEMTFSHQLVRLLFLEQLYRAYTILHGEPYHND